MSEFLLKYSSVLQLQQAETEMMDWLLDCYLKELRETLQLSDVPPAINNMFVSPQTPTMNGIPAKPSPSPVHHLQQQQVQQQAAYGQKKPEEVISELKKKYSGQVLQVAQSKKKKKNFGKDATDHLNMWYVYKSCYKLF